MVPVWPGTAPGSEGATWREVIGDPPPPYNGGSRWVCNVTAPTITAFLPDPAKASGTGIVIAPGGGFKWLSIDTEGYDVARWLQARGVAASVLKYRVAHTPDDEAGLRPYGDAFVTQLVTHPITTDRDLGNEAGWGGRWVAGAAGGPAARGGAGLGPEADWRGGLLGRGQIANAVATRYDAVSRPGFAAAIYGIASSAPVPADAPPSFLADPLAAPATDLALMQAWRAGGHPVELHLFASGVHGYGDVPQGKTSDHWLEEFGCWMQARGLAKAQQAEGRTGPDLSASATGGLNGALPPAAAPFRSDSAIAARVRFPLALRAPPRTRPD